MDTHINQLNINTAIAPIGDILDLGMIGIHVNPDNELRRQYTLSAAPIIATYID